MFAWLAGTRFGRWCAGVFAAIVALGALALAMFVKGRKSGEAKGEADAARVRAADAAAALAQQQSDSQAAEDAQHATDNLPDPGTVAPDAAPPDSAAGELHGAGWVLPDTADPKR